MCRNRWAEWASAASEKELKVFLEKDNVGNEDDDDNKTFFSSNKLQFFNNDCQYSVSLCLCRYQNVLAFFYNLNAGYGSNGNTLS